MFKKLKLKTKLILAFFFASFFILLIGGFSVFEISKNVKPIEKDIPSFLSDISIKSHLNDLAQLIKYYDEVLTQSARNYVFTEDKKWEQRYNENVTKLDTAIKEALELGDDQDKLHFQNIDLANLVLVRMETEALDLGDKGNFKEAIKLLESKEYWDQKNIYKEGIDSYVNRRSSESNKSISASLDSMRAISEKTRTSTNSINIFVITLTIFSFILSIVLGAVITNSIIRRILNLKKVSKKITEGNLDERIKSKSEDEIGELSETFNLMAEKLHELYEGLEKKVKERTEKLEQSEAVLKKILDESERANKLMVGRELKMIELKEQIKKQNEN